MGSAPLAVLLPTGALIALAFSSDQPLVLAAVLAGSAALLAAARGPRFAWLVGALSGLGLALLNPLVSSSGERVLARGPDLPLVDLEITAEEVAYGLAVGARLCAVVWLCFAALLLVDSDRLLARAAVVLPRSTILVALGTRLVPVLQRDARGIGEAARLRGLSLRGGSRLAGLRRFARLTVPLLATSLERGLDQGEALAARGFGLGRPTRLPEPPLSRRERLAAAGGILLAAGLGAALALGALGYRYYPTLEGPGGAGGVALAAGALAVSLATASLLGRRT